MKMTKTTGFFKTIGLAISEMITESAKFQEELRIRNFKAVKKDFDAIMNEHLDNDDIFEEGIDILKEHRRYRTEATIENMKMYIEKYSGKVENQEREFEKVEQ